MMKNFRRFLLSFFAIAMLLGLATGSVWAEKNEAYTYKITFYAGNRGTFENIDGLYVDNENAVITHTSDKVVISGLNADDIVSINAQVMVPLDASSKYYVQGVRLAGYDNNTVADSVFWIDRDVNYVVAYGIKGNMTSYTVKYQDANGTTLAPDQIYYGNVGDKPVVGYLYVDGYAPRYIGLTKTLSANEAENIMTFIYDKLPDESFIVYPSQPPEEDDNQQVGPGNRPGQGENQPGEENQGGNEPGGENQGGNEPGGENQGGNEPGGENQGGNEPGGETPGGNEPGQDGPGGIYDIDDEDTPLGNIDLDKDKDKITEGLPLIGYIGLGLLALIILALIVAILVKRKMDKE